MKGVFGSLDALILEFSFQYVSLGTSLRGLAWVARGLGGDVEIPIYIPNKKKKNLLIKRTQGKSMENL